MRPARRPWCAPCWQGIPRARCWWWPTAASASIARCRTVQVLHALGQHALARLDPRYVPPILGRAGRPRAASGTQWAVCWTYRAGLACEDELPRADVPGRVLYVQLTRAGFRPQPLYLFTSLPDEACAPLDELVALYAERGQVEIVCTPMTKADVLAGRRCGDDGADLDITVGDDYPVDQQLDELTFLLEGRLGEPALDARAESFH